MDEFFFSEDGLNLTIDNKYSNSLNLHGFYNMMSNPSFCYKYYWLEAIVCLISRNISETTFDAVIDEMICRAWFSVRGFHIHLSGILENGESKDGLERAILTLSKLSGLPAYASDAEIKNEIKKYNDELKAHKEQLTNMVPYRALSKFFPKTLTEKEWGSIRRLTAYIEKVNVESCVLPYTIGNSSKLNKEIYFNPIWMRMIQDNTVSILGWINYEKVKWLQNTNPEVPGLVYKLVPADEKIRKLNHVRDLWNGILSLSCINDIFTGEQIDFRKYDVDHFIPWTFVMNDELWNLMPMNSSLNSSKSNKLPKWNPFFRRFAENQFIMYEHIQLNEMIHKLYIDCFRDNLHSIWASQELYRRGNTKEEFYNILEKNMQPVYDSARRQGYEIWNKAI